MSDRLDDRIRRLYAELTDAAPDLPPLPAPAPRRVPLLARPAVLAGAAAVLVAVAGIGFLVSRVDFSGDDSAATTAAPATTAAATTGTAAAATGAPTTPAPTATPITTTVAAETTTTAGPPRDDARIRLLAALDLTCTGASDAIEAAVPSRPDSEEAYRAAFTLMFEQIENLRLAVAAADPSLEDELRPIKDEIAIAQDAVVLGGDEPLAARYPEAVAAVEHLGLVLFEYGAPDCTSLETALP